MEKRKNSTHLFPQSVEKDNAHLCEKSEKLCKYRDFFPINVENHVENVDKNICFFPQKPVETECAKRFSFRTVFACAFMVMFCFNGRKAGLARGKGLNGF